MTDPESLFHDIAQDNVVIHYFKNHSLRVMLLSSSLGKRYGCYDENLRIAAMLHDIGKMGISKEILFKPDRLNDLEMEIIKTHPHTGNRIVRNYLGFPEAAEYVRDHHERWDGAGYPRGLKGKEISIQGRIISICDAYDTMTLDNRSYKKDQFNSGQAVSELMAQAGKQFDSELVHLFIDMLPEIKIPMYLLD
ncbi:MAG TPA: HD domain-containing phosphohydrolase [Bacillales bacterium]|nr:HD domain-containing phosphohydrolase [Bacillales bacterium]